MAERIALSFDDGYKEIEINGDPERVIRLNPTDAKFLNRLANFDESSKRIQEKYGDIDLNSITDLQNLNENDSDFSKYKKVAETADKLDSAMRELINDIFGYDISSIVFSSDSCLSPAGGQPVFINFMNAVFAYIKQEAEIEAEKSKTKIRKYTDEAKKISVQTNTPSAGKTAQNKIDLSELTPEQIAFMDYLKNNQGMLR